MQNPTEDLLEIKEASSSDSDFSSDKDEKAKGEKQEGIEEPLTPTSPLDCSTQHVTIIDSPTKLSNLQSPDYTDCELDENDASAQSQTLYLLGMNLNKRL